MPEEPEHPAFQLWLKAYEELILIDKFLFSKTLDLLQEAARCHDCGSYVACAVMCRGTTESLLHTLKGWRKQGDRYYLAWEGRMRFKDLIQWAREKAVINGTEAEIADRIREMGDLSAHLGERVDEERVEQVPRGRPYRLWVGKDESWSLYKNTVGLVTELPRRRRTDVD